MLKSPKAKGYRHELFVRNMIRAFGWEAQRSPLSGGFVGMKGDIVSASLPIFVECKNTETTTFLPWYKKASDQTDGKPPVIVWTKNGEDVYAFLSFTDLLMLMRGATPIKEKFTKPQKTKRLSLEETSGLQFSKLSQTHRK